MRWSTSSNFSTNYGNSLREPPVGDSLLRREPCLPHLKTLAEFLTTVKARDFVGFALPFKLPLDASKYTRMELEEFDPVVSSMVAQPGDPVWILVMDHEIWVYKRTNISNAVGRIANVQNPEMASAIEHFIILLERIK